MRKLRGQITLFDESLVEVRSKYKKGMVLDVRTGNDIPDRIKITGVYTCGGKIKYHIICESDSSRDNISTTEEYIDSILSHKYKKRRAPVYDKEIIKLRYAAGWRFSTNRGFDECKDVVRRLKNLGSRLSGIRITEAYGPTGNILTNGEAAVWVKYTHQLDGDEFDPNNIEDSIMDIEEIVKPDGRFTIDIME